MADKGFFDKVAGKVKETVGDLTNNPELKAEGQIDQGKGVVKEKVEEGKEAIGNAADSVKDRVDGGDKNGFDEFKETVGEKFEEGKEAVGNAVNSVKEKLEGKDADPNAKSGFDSFKDSVGEKFNEGKEAAGNAFHSVKEGAKDTFGQGGAKVQEQWDNAKKVIEEKKNNLNR